MRFSVVHQPHASWGFTSTASSGAVCSGRLAEGRPVTHTQGARVKRFIVNRHGRIVFPFNFLPRLDFSAFDARASFEAAIKRDFMDKAPNGAQIRERIRQKFYRTRRALLTDIARHLRSLHRYTMTMYEKRPTRWADVPRRRDDVYWPSLRHTAADDALAVELDDGYRDVDAGEDRETEDRTYAMLIAAYRAATRACIEAITFHPTVADRLAAPAAAAYHSREFAPDFSASRDQVILDYAYAVPEIDALMRHAMVL